MKRFALAIFALFLMTIGLGALSGCSNQKENPQDVLYNWLLENGELVDGSDFVYKDGDFTLYTDSSRKMFVDCIIHDYNGYEVTVQLPLFSGSKNVKGEIIVQNKDSYGRFFCYHNPENFTMKTPLSFDRGYQNPDIETISLDDYGTFKDEDGKLIFCLDESKREEYERKKEHNEETNRQIELREGIAREVSHKAISSILDWLNKKTNIDASDLGYAQYNASNKK